MSVRETAAELIEQYYDEQDNKETVNRICQRISIDFPLIEVLLTDSTLYKELYNEDNPELLDPPAGFKGRRN